MQVRFYVFTIQNWLNMLVHTFFMQPHAWLKPATPFFVADSESCMQEEENTRVAANARRALQQDKDQAARKDQVLTPTCILRTHLLNL